MKKRKRKQEVKENDNKDESAEENITNYCCAFNKIFNKNLDQKEKQQFRNELDELVLTLARLRHETSYLANYILLQQCGIQLEADLKLIGKKNPIRHQNGFLDLNNPDLWENFYSMCMNIIIEGSKEDKTKKEKKLN